MSDMTLIAPWIRRFLMEHLIGERNYSRNTQVSYRDTLVILLPFVSKKLNKSVDNLCINDVSSMIIRLFLSYLEKDRGCSISTRNQRLAAIHALARFIGERSPEHIVWCKEIRSVPFKKTTKPTISYLEKAEMDALLDAPNRHTLQGKRDYALLLFLYNTGARADEAAHLTIANLNKESYPSVKILGKGNKVRFCPLWSLTVKTIKPLTEGRASNDHVFLNRRKQPITRFGIYNLVKRNIAKASQQMKSIQTKKVSVHTIRHTTAVHLLRAGVDINTIRAWLGHVSLDTTYIYAETDLEMKAKALAHCEIMESVQTKKLWTENEELMEFLSAM